MRHLLGPLLLLASLPLASACSGPRAGDSCNQSGFLCLDEATALECRAGTWTALPCRGPGGCSRQTREDPETQQPVDVITCDMTANQEGDACASSAEGKGFCAEGGKAVYECRRGTIVRTLTCTTCETVTRNGELQLECDTP